MSRRDPEREAARQRAFFAAHPGKRKEYQERFKARHPEKAAAQAERAKERQRARYQAAKLANEHSPRDGSTSASKATARYYGNYTTPHNIRRVWAEVTRTPCASSQDLGARLGMPFSAVSMALRVLRDAGYIDFPHNARHARVVLVPFYVGDVVR